MKKLSRKGEFFCVGSGDKRWEVQTAGDPPLPRECYFA